MWGATYGTPAEPLFKAVSIHAPRVGCDVVKIGQQAEEEKFQFTHPVWGATIPGLDGELPVYEFQFTHPVWGAT